MGTAAANHSNKLTFGSLGASEVGPAAEVGRSAAVQLRPFIVRGCKLGRQAAARFERQISSKRREGSALLTPSLAFPPRRRAQGRSDQTCARTWTVVND